MIVLHNQYDIMRKHRVLRCISILLISAFLCIVLTLYWKVAVVPLLNEKGESDSYGEARFQNLLSYRHRLRQRYPVPNSKELIRSSYHDNDNIDDNDSELKVAETEIRERLANVTRLCKQYHLGQYKWGNNSNDLRIKEPPTPLFSYYFWNKEKRLAWCPVYKAGSTSWLQNMMRLAGYSEESIKHPPRQLSIWAREVYGDSDNFRRDELDKSLKLLVVRHPFERLLSAYRDKLANSTYGQEHGTHHFYLKYGQRIVQKFRRDPTLTQLEPTWEEFVRYILKTDLIQYADDHWLPAYHSCTPCLVDYSIIAKTETYFRDQKYIIRRAGLGHILKPRWSHSTADTGSQSRIQLKKRYFSQLTKSQVNQLYEKYKLDFLLFGYDHKEYLEYATESPFKFLIK